jgi:hypothetical protein
LADATGGKERLELSGVWKDLPRQPRLIELAPWLLLTAIGLLLVEVLERHTGLVTARALPVLQKLRPKLKAKLARPVAAKPLPAPASKIAPDAAEEMKVEPETRQPEPAAILGALQQARQKAEERTKR